jgi:hypothetical protein
METLLPNCCCFHSQPRRLLQIHQGYDKRGWLLLLHSKGWVLLVFKLIQYFLYISTNEDQWTHSLERRAKIWVIRNVGDGSNLSLFWHCNTAWGGPS